MSETEVVTLDDRDPRITYSLGWWTSGQSTDYNGTTSVCGFLNSYFDFTFSGTSISVYGSVPVNTTNLSSYTLDRASPVTYASPNLTASYTSKQLMYQSPTLADGTHLLHMECLTSFGVPHQFPAAGQIYFDYLVYEPGASGTGRTGDATSTVAQTSSGTGAVAPSIAPTAVPRTGAATSTTSRLATTAEVTFTTMLDTEATMTTSTLPASTNGPTSTALSGSGTVGRRGTKLGVVLPAVLVPAFAILVLLGAMMVCLRRRRHQAETNIKQIFHRRLEDDMSGPVTPFHEGAWLTRLNGLPPDVPRTLYSNATRRASSEFREQDLPFRMDYNTLGSNPPLSTTSTTPLAQHLDGGTSLGSESAWSEA